jgi:phage tail-like protein
MRSSGIPLGLNWTAGVAQRARPDLRLDPYMAYNFLIEIEGLLVGGFSDVSGMESRVELEDQREGGVNDFVHHLPRQTIHTNLVLTHGLTDVSTLWNWYYNVTQGIVERKNGTIMLMNQRQLPVMWWNIRNALPVRWAGPHFQATSDAVAFEVIELAHEGLTKPLVGQALAAARGVAKLATGEDLY